MCYSLTMKEQTLIQNFKKSNKHICHYCNKNICQNNDLTVDHLTPVSRGGKTENNNLAICCYSCNQEKADMTEEEYKIYLSEKEKLVENNDLVKETKNIINTYQTIIDKYSDIIKEISEQNILKTNLEHAIRDEIYNASEGYNLCRDLRNILIKMSELTIQKNNMTAIYNHAKDEIKKLEDINKKTITNLYKQLKVTA